MSRPLTKTELDAQMPPTETFVMEPTAYLEWKDGALMQQWSGRSGSWSRLEWRPVPQSGQL